ncbi:leucyl aminopeptidase family protein [Kordiimonas pumila]|uniref:Leucyl aminopeptidase family protein n=1 Tax=Kordiimonas pumila TaxID=2161677 RepID=A0ABV7D5B9_9PROT|nr:leucyl aminopeptidase family protein [Kordiimonas pumila]
MTDFTTLLVSETDSSVAVPLEFVTEADLQSLSQTEQEWVKIAGFTAEAGTICPLPTGDQKTGRMLAGLGTLVPTANNPWWAAAVCEKLPAGSYKITNTYTDDILAAGAFGWCMVHYKFDRYFTSASVVKQRQLTLPLSVDTSAIQAEAHTYALVRDLVNTPTEDMGPADLQDAVEALAEEFGGTCGTFVGDDLIDENFPAVHAVGRAAATGREPRLIDLRWGTEGGPKLTLVGKGVCYDTGGLDLKPGSGMRLMKKDMGGAAHAIGLARMIMQAGLKVDLRVIIPAVENAVSSNSYRPGDIISTRKGLFVEVGNTDAEGRIILCDALAFACEEKPDLLLDFATLTGAARVALGADLPATYTNTDPFWAALEAAAAEKGDPLWRMPLWAPYDKKLNSPVADLSNISEGGMAGSITAALYLQRFIEADTPWAHFDLYAWTLENQPGRPQGAAVQAIRASFEAIIKFLSLDA